ncbi:MAG: tRNA (adenosine(37)-N6)-threonylcarbamoyltransferase complex transferase subunit TsaD [Spirochaetaceae bacterium]|jgi:N6-L-threonylcarbamoyladenine synthase|nr:tRNA (adenosine(37)-N6)-threonylcarbamoyltransferase complex transferase subunit TsaD [Spirochaetaceae bacterium]
MLVLGIETSCDECAAAVVEDGAMIRSNVVATQIPFHARWGGVVPEIASRKHTEWIDATVREALDGAGLAVGDVDAVAATAEPGLLGSLLVGLTFGKAFAWTRGIPFVPVNHLYAHLYAARLCGGHGDGGKDNCFAGSPPPYPYLGLLVSGGHSMICRVDDFDKITTLGTTLDDAAGEAFDKVGKHYGLPYPAGKYVDEMAKTGDEDAFLFPMPNLHKNGRPSDMSFSGLKNAVINQRETFRQRTRSVDGEGTAPSGENGGVRETADVIASFQKAAVKILLRALFRAVDDTGITTVVAGGGVAANSCLRARLAERTDIRAVFPPPELCGDNGAMVAGFAYHKLRGGDISVTADACSTATGAAS